MSIRSIGNPTVRFKTVWDRTGKEAKYVAPPPDNVDATGGVKFTSGDYTYHFFLSPGTFSVSTSANESDIKYVIIAGGGGGGHQSYQRSGGGGAGGYRYSTGYAITDNTDYPIVVGGGSLLSAGENSSAFGQTSSGGGYAGGGSFGDEGGDGGSGGGGGGPDGYPGYGGGGGSGNSPPVSPSQGNPGGPAGANTNASPGAGGGGLGSHAGPASTSSYGGHGEHPMEDVFPYPIIQQSIPAPLQSNWLDVVTGPSPEYASPQDPGTAELCRGGNGKPGPSDPATIDYAGYGGHGQYPGGSGIVMIRYPTLS